MAFRYIALTDDEERAVAALEKVAEIWPKSLWLFSAVGNLCVMKKSLGVRAMMGEGVDRRWCACVIDIENDGGDW